MWTKQLSLYYPREDRWGEIYVQAVCSYHVPEGEEEKEEVRTSALFVISSPESAFLLVSNKNTAN